MEVKVFDFLEDAPQASGTTIIIDVFRAFTTEAYAFLQGAEKIIPVKTLEEAYELKKQNPEFVLV
jgi:2-phosphosulfolactate phosphatase